MSVITLQYGQCGNQVGESLFSAAYEDINAAKKGTNYHSEAVNKWFNITKTGKWEPRSILIDTESKTIHSKKGASYTFKNVVAKACGGSANNWAFGYADRSHLLMEEIAENVRIEVEKCDLLNSFLTIFSSSGGTGAGVGTCIGEYLRNEFPNKTIVTALILPYMNGEVVTQSYNSLLTLSKIYSISDATIIFENDRLHYNCKNSLGIKDVNFNNINQLISQQLLSVYQPLNEWKPEHILAKLSAHSSYKFLQLKHAPVSLTEAIPNWKSLLGSLSRQSRFDFQQQSVHALSVKPKQLASALICRGVYSPNEQDLKSYKESHLGSSWLPPHEQFQLYHQSAKIFNLDNALTLISNSNNVYLPINFILKDAWNMFRFGAYLHHYKKFGVDEAYFKNSFQILQTILNNYEKL